MKTKITLSSLLLCATFTGLGMAAGGPMNEDLTVLNESAQKAISSGKAGDAATFEKDAEQTLQEARSRPDSAAQQRIVGKLKRAINTSKAGKLAEAVEFVEEATDDMKKSGAPKFGGGS